MRLILGLVTLTVLCMYSPKAWAAPGDGGDQCPRLGSDGANSFYAIWESDYELHGALSTNNGQTWSAPQKLDETPVLWNGRYEMHPQAVVYANGEWVVYYRYTKFNISEGVFIRDYVIRSVDGVSWTSPQFLNGSNTTMMWAMAPAYLSMGDMVSDNNNTIVAFTGPGQHVYRSVDGGDTWTSSTLGGSAYFGVDRYNVAYAGNQTWQIAYSGNGSIAGGSASAFSTFYTSTDNGLTWSTSATTTDFIMAGDLAAKDSQLVVFSDPEFNYSLDGGTTWQEPSTAQPDTLNSLTVNSAGKWIAATSETFYTTSDPSAGWTSGLPPAIPGDGAADWPVFATNGTRIGLARSYNPDPEALPADIIFQYSDDGGITWSTSNMISDEPTAASDWQLFQ